MMSQRLILFFLLPTLLLGIYYPSLESVPVPYQQKALVYDPTPYILPKNHPLRSILDSIFAKSNVIENETAFTKAGFTTIRHQRASGIRLATHPKVKGYLFKLYLDSDTCNRGHLIAPDWLIQRCIGAAKIRSCIQANHISCFSVPDKWLYEVHSSKYEKMFVLIATKMNIYPLAESRIAWQTKATKQALRELYIIMNNGCASGALALNIPYTKEGKFSFIDTEYPQRTFDFEHVVGYLSPQMGIYWKKITQKG